MERNGKKNSTETKWRKRDKLCILQINLGYFMLFTLRQMLCSIYIISNPKKIGERNGT